ncbi:hypothetical protein ACCO45_007947 [Purpureocillium lilacinum]|uniref:Uncharacterized protein n=1 Tax=Purpureocillium lilacinum TaxID=33203 RepID=A0ACC4DNC4_PURLI
MTMLRFSSMMTMMISKKGVIDASDADDASGARRADPIRSDADYEQSDRRTRPESALELQWPLLAYETCCCKATGRRLPRASHREKMLVTRNPSNHRKSVPMVRIPRAPKLPSASASEVPRVPSPALEVPGGRRGSIGPSTAGTSSLYFAPQCRARGGFAGHLPPLEVELQPPAPGGPAEA